MKVPADIHTHILPAMDDGSRSVEVSLGMLREEKRQGISTVVLTPHYYAGQNSPDEFLKRREQAWQRLQPSLEKDMPRLLLGAEVQYFEGISRVEEISELCIGDTDFLLLEMPFRKWTDRVIQEAFELQNERDLDVILAHVDRYFAWQPNSVWKRMAEGGFKMQLNADAFLSWRTRVKALSLMRKGMVQFLASDCHNLDKRPPNLKAAERWFSKYSDFLLPV